MEAESALAQRLALPPGMGLSQEQQEDQSRSHMVTTDASWFVAPWGLHCLQPQKYLDRLCRRLEDSYGHTGEPEQELRVIDMNVT